MKTEFELNASQAENLLNMVLSRADLALAEDLSRYDGEGRKNLREQVAAAIILYEAVVKTHPAVAEMASVRVFWEDNGLKYRAFVERLSEEGGGNDLSKGVFI